MSFQGGQHCRRCRPTSELKSRICDIWCFDIWQSRKPGESALRWLARGVPGLDGRFQVSSRVWRQRQPLISKSEHNVPHYFIRPSEHCNYIYIAQFNFSSRDLHPVGWAERTGHPLQEPLTPEEVGRLLVQ